MSHLACKACGIGVLKLAAARWLTCRALRVRGRARWGACQSRLSRAEPGRRAARARACRAPASRHRVRCALRTPDPWEGSSGELDFTELLDATVHAIPGGVGVAKWNAARQARLPNQTPSASACWHEGPTGSAALWQLYTARGLGVAVKSTPARVHPLWVAD